MNDNTESVGCGAVDYNLGTSGSISGDTALIRAKRDNDNLIGLDTGLAYVFRRTASIWVEEAILTASDEAAGDQFGTSVSISGDLFASRSLSRRRRRNEF